MGRRLGFFEQCSRDARLREEEEERKKRAAIKEAERREREAVRKAKQVAVEKKERKKNLAVQRTAKAKDALQEIEETLLRASPVTMIDWNSLLDNNPFPEPEPLRPKSRWYIKIFGRLNQMVEDKYNIKLKYWQESKKEYEKEQARNNNPILVKKKLYFDGNTQAIVNYSDMVLRNSRYPKAFPHTWGIEYLEEAKALWLDYFLPSPEAVPKLKEVRYIASKDEFQELFLSESDFNKMYDSLLYQITLRTIYEIFQSDQVNRVDAVGFNGWIKSISKGTGNDVTMCVLSIYVPWSVFKELDLWRANPKECFKSLRSRCEINFTFRCYRGIFLRLQNSWRDRSWTCTGFSIV